MAMPVGFLEGYGQSILVATAEAYSNPAADMTLEFPVSDALAFRSRCIAKGLKLVHDVVLEGCGVGYVDVEDCDGRVIRFQET